MLNCKYCNSLRKNERSLVQHEIRCYDNPNRIKYRTEGKVTSDEMKSHLSNLFKGKVMRKTKISDEEKRNTSERLLKYNHSSRYDVRMKISNSMKKAHSEGRAWNIGKSRWNNKPSYPEIFFTNVIENEFSDKKYLTEMPFHKYSLDFAWPHLKKCIEIDGGWHTKDEKQKIRDKKKNELLLEEGWEFIRVPWKEMFKDTKFWIDKCVNFIDVG